MFAPRYFANRYFPQRYFPNDGDVLGGEIQAKAMIGDDFIIEPSIVNDVVLGVSIDQDIVVKTIIK